MIPTVDPIALHADVESMYSWHDVAVRAEKVYHLMIQMPQLSLLQRLRRYYACGLWAGKLLCLAIVLDLLLNAFLSWIQPANTIDIVPNATQCINQQFRNKQDIDKEE